MHVDIYILLKILSFLRKTVPNKLPKILLCGINCANKRTVLRKGVVMEFSDDEVRKLANKIAEIIYPQIEELIKSKSQWTVSQLEPLKEGWLTVAKVAKIFDVHPNHVRNMMNQGLEHMWFGNVVKIHRDTIDQAIREGSLVCRTK